MGGGICVPGVLREVLLQVFTCRVAPVLVLWLESVQGVPTEVLAGRVGAV